MRTGLLVTVLLVLAACGRGDVLQRGDLPQPSPHQMAPAPTDEPFYAPDFTLDTLDGGTVTLSDARGRWALVNFWATWCAPCLAEMPALNTLAAENSDWLVVYGVNMRETPNQMRPFLIERGVMYPILIDPPDSVVLEYNVIGLPQTVAIDPEGIIVWLQFGPLDLDGFGTLLASLRSGQTQ